MTATYVDAGVLFAVFRGEPTLARRALDVLEDPERSFVASAFLRLELLPKATFHRRAAEVAYYQAFFAGVSAWAAPFDRIVELAEQEANRHGLGAVDALHVAAAVVSAADELVTTERPTSPLHRTTSLRA